MVLPTETLIVPMYQPFFFFIYKENVQNNHSFAVVDCSTTHEVKGALLLSDGCCLKNHFPGTLSICLKKLFEHNSCEQHKQTASHDITAVCLNS